MLAAVRRGQVLARAIRARASTPLKPSQPLAQLSQWHQLVPRRFLQPVRCLHSAPAAQFAAPAIRQIDEEEDLPVAGQGSITKFQELSDSGLVSSRVIDTIVNKMGITTMTEIQSGTINQTLKGVDVLAQARTGTGKTLAFLMPIMQRILQDQALERGNAGRKLRSDASDIRALIISPTRELAEQISVEAKKVAQNTGVVVQTAVGGTMRREGLQRIQREGCHILVGTPGRLKDILSDQYTGVAMPKLEVFVLDEADRLLDIGFGPDIEEIKTFFPQNTELQTMMFSATMPDTVIDLVRTLLKSNFEFVGTVGRDEDPTHKNVPQRVVWLRGLQNQNAALLELAKRSIEANKSDPQNNRPFKAIVYYNSTAEVSMASEIFRNLKVEGAGMFGPHPLEPATIVEMHSKLTQGQRTRNSAIFRGSKSAILFSSDVTARGMDFPDVTHVIQMGMPKEQESYIHRIGRTARAGKTGEGWLFLSDFEQGNFRHTLGPRRGFHIQPDTSITTADVDMSTPSSLPGETASILTQVGQAAKIVPYGFKRAAFMAMFGIYQNIGDKQLLVDRVNELSRYGWGLGDSPPIPPGSAAKMGLSRVRGLNLGHDRNEDDYGDRQRPASSGFGGRGGRDGGGRGGGGFGARDRNDFGGRGSSSYGSRSSGGYGSRSTGGYSDKGSSGGYSDRGSSGGYGSDRGGSDGGFRGSRSIGR